MLSAATETKHLPERGIEIVGMTELLHGEQSPGQTVDQTEHRAQQLPAGHQPTDHPLIENLRG